MLVDTEPLCQTQRIVWRVHLGIIVEVHVRIASGAAAPPLDPRAQSSSSASLYPLTYSSVEPCSRM